jgi:uncharacterized membrane protein
MLSYSVYHFIHLGSLFIIMTCLGAIASHRLQGGTKENFKNRKLFMMFHGLGLLLSFVAGFGLMARAGFSFSSGWVWVKVIIWFILGMYPVVYYKKGDTKGPYFAMLALILVAVYMVTYKPF